MTRPWILLALLLLTGCTPDGAREGQRGLDAYLAGDLETAAVAFGEGLQATDTPDADLDVRARLLYDLGLVRHEEGDAEAAIDLFEQAAQIAPTRRAQARARYNAGTAAALAQDFEAALDHLRQALLLDPRYAEAKVNYELVKRQLDGDQPEPPEEQPPPEPSAFAEEVKARADALIASLRYADALEAMQAGLAVDSTVEAYADFITRLQGVVGIEETAEGQPAP
ncbi:MAG: tetratricopeptide repeat protein [Bacteroidota bacterium]